MARIPPFFSGVALNDFVVANIAISTTETEVKVGATPFERRTGIILVNDSSYFIYAQNYTPFSISTSITIFSGEAIFIDIDPANDTRYYVKMEFGSSEMRIYELR